MTDMINNLFSILSKYKPRENISSEENFSTEILAYLLNYSLKNNTNLFSSFMKKHLSEIININDYVNFSIETQRPFITKNNSKAYPDITIENKINRIYYFIEVKIESGLNYYFLEQNGNSKTVIDQIEKYEKIVSNNEKRIFLLTKYYCDLSLNKYGCFKNKNRIRWYEIHRNFKDYLSEHYQRKENQNIEYFLVNETIKYMEDMKMTIPKVSYELTNGMKSLNNLFQQLEIVLEGIPNKNSFGKYWLGYNIYLNKGDETTIGWVGTCYEGNRITFQIFKEEAFSSLKEKFTDIEISKNEKELKIYFDFEKEHYFCLSPDEQIDKLREWIRRIYNNLKNDSNNTA